MSNIIQEQFIGVYQTHSDAIFRYCYYRVFDRKKAKRLVSQIYCQAWQCITDGNNIKDITLCIYRIAHNLSSQSPRKHNLFWKNVMEKIFFSDHSKKNREQYPNSDQEIIRAMELLDEQYREVIILKCINNLSLSQISQVTNETEEIVASKLEAGQLQIKEILQRLPFKEDHSIMRHTIEA